MKLNVFISSRNNDPIMLDDGPGDNLSTIRLFIKDELEKIKMFDKDFLSIRINEEFGAAATSDFYNNCLDEIKQSDFFIALYNGAAGWAPEGIDMGICHAELSKALDISTRKFAIIDIEKYFKLVPENTDEALRNEKFKKYIETLKRPVNPLKIPQGNLTNDLFKKELLKSLKAIIYNHLSDRIQTSNIYYNLSGNNRISLDWRKLKYTDRNRNITGILKDLISNSPNFSKLITQAFSIPDNMSVEDAKSFTGRPFLKDHENEQVQSKDPAKHGPIHFIGVYGNATELQVKNLIGYPDISAIRDDFGLYVWEQNTHVQLVFLVDCKTPEAIKSNFILFNNWCDSTGEIENIKKRAKARFHILTAINEARQIAVKV
jgi:hypothetical protein